MGEQYNLYKFPPLKDKDADKDFCHFPRKCWYSSSDPRKIEQNSRILLIRPSSIGDVLLLTPVIRQHKNDFPHVQIDVATIHGELFNGNINVDKIVRLTNKTYKEKDIDTKNYHAVFWMAYEFTPQIHVVEAYANILGIKVKDYKPQLFVSTKETEEAFKCLNSYKVKHRFIALHRECTWKSRKYSDKSWDVFVRMFKDKHPDFDVLVFSQGETKPIENTIPIIGKDIRLVAAMLRCAQMLVCIDSGLMHIGTAVGIPVVSLFSITDPNKRLPDNYLETALQIDTVNAGVHHRRPIPSEGEPYATDFSVDNIPPQFVMDKCQKILGL